MRLKAEELDLNTKQRESSVHYIFMSYSFQLFSICFLSSCRAKQREVRKEEMFLCHGCCLSARHMINRPCVVGEAGFYWLIHLVLSD